MNKFKSPTVIVREKPTIFLLHGIGCCAILDRGSRPRMEKRTLKCDEKIARVSSKHRRRRRVIGRHALHVYNVITLINYNPTIVKCTRDLRSSIVSNICFVPFAFVSPPSRPLRCLDQLLPAYRRVSVRYNMRCVLCYIYIKSGEKETKKKIIKKKAHIIINKYHADQSTGCTVIVRGDPTGNHRRGGGCCCRYRCCAALCSVRQTFSHVIITSIYYPL